MAPPAEITIPTTSLQTPADNSKPYTLYNITLRLPLRTFVVQKRYSDFTTLHQTLTTLVGAPPPAPLPGKSWFKSTVTSPELTEDRRRGLEAYLRAIAESPDRRWRDTPAWRTFLNLPSMSSTGNSAASVRAGYGIPSRDAANAAAAQDPGTWLDLHGEMKRDFQEARRCLARRDSAMDNSAALEAGSAAKKALVKAGSLLAVLGDGLRVMQDAKRLGDGEIRRRKDLLAAARVEREDLEKLSTAVSAAAKASQRAMPSAADKAALVGNGPKGRGRVLGAPLPESERTRELDNGGVVQLQRQMMKEQDEDVEALGKIIRKQREMAVAINREVEEQTEMLDHVNNQTDVLSGKVNVAKNRTKKIS
ncbi:Vacuolar morphogenesis protein 7 like protein [Daldinia childiae]|uniref:Vacuolar morphogenesis protein 7 like protein n=1 Tax=Daldinia childiae TaxID=326645 RepID=UPI0014479B05|nr:Vacuolar morphogenesis protein 7 like protein [Daldinia childiae]KAF3065043.1 Vacuolar morphogenesis protein 7 like protein [Daldinia childiae]